MSEMRVAPRAVTPWTWRRALRDHWPGSPTILLTLYTIGVSMNGDGIAWPSQKKIAAGIRGSVKTVQRHIAVARRMGWLSIELAGRGGKGWRHYVYRAAVPDTLALDDVDEELADCVVADVVADVGEVEPHERSDTMMSPPSDRRGDSIVSPPPPQRSDTIVSPPSAAMTRPPERERDCHKDVRGDNGRSKVATFATFADVTSGPKVATQLCRTNSGSETPAYRTHASEEGGLNAQSRVETTDGGVHAKVEKLMRTRLHLSDQEIANICGEPVDEVRAARATLRGQE